MLKINNIARNTSYLTLALILQKIISFTYFTLLARYVGPVSLGKYYFAISFTTIFAIFIDLGLGNVLIREVAKKADDAGRWLANVLALKIPLALISLITVFILINVLGYDSLTKNLVYVSSICMVLDSFTNTFFAVIRGFHNLKYESSASIIFQLIVLIVGYSALLLGGGLIIAMIALALASSFNFLYSLLVLKNKIKVNIKLIWDTPFIRKILILGWPFAMYAIFQRLYTYLDSVLLSILAGDLQVGLYQVAFKIIFALQFLPMAFVASLYPAMSTYWQNNREQLVVSFTRALNYLLIISLPIIVGTFILGNKIILLFKDGYGEALWPLRISIIALFFIFINFPIGSLLNACDRQKKNTLNMGIVMIVSLILNLLLIPHWQALGASITVLITNALMTILGFIWVKQIIPYHFKHNFSIFLKVIFSSLIMGLIVFLGKNYINIFIITFLGAIVYFLCLFVFRALKIEDIKSIIKSFKLKS